MYFEAFQNCHFSTDFRQSRLYNCEKNCNIHTNRFHYKIYSSYGAICLLRRELRCPTVKGREPCYRMQTTIFMPEKSSAKFCEIAIFFTGNFSISVHHSNLNICKRKSTGIANMRVFNSHMHLHANAGSIFKYITKSYGKSKVNTQNCGPQATF